jgi:hypothetical protein
MAHLAPEQFVDLADGVADAAVEAHAASCEACRSRFESLRDALRAAEADLAAEPSPLFWPHLAARIGDAVRREPAPRAAWHGWAWRLAPIGAVAALLVVIGIGWAIRQRAPVDLAGAAQAAGDRVIGDDDAEDPSWRLVSELSSQISLDEAEASGVFPAPGGTDRALSQLDEGERAELGRILLEEIEARGPAVPQAPGA